MSEVILIFAHITGGILALIGTLAIVYIVMDLDMEFDWDEYDLGDEDDGEEHL